MSFEEIGHSIEPAHSFRAAEHQQEIAETQAGTVQSRADLGSGLEKQWPDIPGHAVKYLATHCKGNLLIVISEARKSLAEDPAIFDDPDIAQFELDDCIAVAELAAIENAKQNATEKLSGNVDQLASLKKRISSNLVGADKLGQLDRLVADVQMSNGFPVTEKEAALKHLSQIRMALAAMDRVMKSEKSQEAFQTLVASSNLNLTSGSLAMTLSPLMAQVENSTDISEEEKIEIRKLVGYQSRDLETGRDVRKAALAIYIDPETGDEVYMHTEETPAEIVPGVTTYTNNGRDIILKVQVAGHTHRIDVTGHSDEMIGLQAEALGFWAGTEALGATSFVEDVYKVDFSILDSGAFDPLKIIEIRQKISYMVGGFEGYDGDIFDPRDKAGLLKAQMRVISETGTVFGWENDRDATKRVVGKLGLQNLDILKEFGHYTQLYYLTGDITQKKLKAHLHTQFPDLVEAATD